jgi:hypothetical protein
MVRFRRQGISAAFIDVVFNLLLGVTLMFFLALILMRPITEDKKVDLKAEFIITMDWPEHINSDIDLWVLNPNSQATGYSQKENGPVALERDDLGNNTDTFVLQSTGETIRIEENHEIITVRTIMPGEFVVNVFYYQAKAPQRAGPPPSARGGEVTPIPPVTRGSIPVEVTVQLIKINPIYKVITTDVLILTNQGEERTAIRFTVDEDGDITVQGNDFVQFVQSQGDPDDHGF